jgi:hypothetical protein
MFNKKTTLTGQSAEKNRLMVERVEGLYKKAHRASLGRYKFYKATMYLKYCLRNLHFNLLDDRTGEPIRKTDLAYAILTEFIEDLEKIRKEI